MKRIYRLLKQGFVRAPFEGLMTLAFVGVSLFVWSLTLGLSLHVHRVDPVVSSVALYSCRQVDTAMDISCLGRVHGREYSVSRIMGSSDPLLDGDLVTVGVDGPHTGVILEDTPFHLPWPLLGSVIAFPFFGLVVLLRWIKTGAFREPR